MFPSYYVEEWSATDLSVLLIVKHTGESDRG